MRASITSAVAGALIAVAMTKPSQASEHYAPQDLAVALKIFAEQSKLYLIYARDDVANRTTSGATGELTREQTLQQLLQGTGLTYKLLDDNTVTIIPIATTSARTGHSKAAPEKTSWRLAQVQTSAFDSPSPKPTASSSESREAAMENTISEVVVTATKRAERLSDIPLSVGVVTADEIDRRGLVSSEDYLRGIPGVTQAGNGLYGESIIIRGLETTRQTQNGFTGNTLATYFDETPTTSSRGISGGSSIDIKLVDVERVEVLRGPQGTAFGSSALGGVVRTIPVAPKLDRFEGKVAASYSQTSGTGGDNNMVQGIGNFPLVDNKLALRVVGYRFEDSGYYRNVGGSDPAFQTSLVIPQSQQEYAIDEDQVGTNRFVGARAALLFQASDDLKFTLSYLKQQIEEDGVGLQNTGRYQKADLQVAPEHRFRGRTGATNDSTIDIANATMEYGLGWADLFASFSYTDSGAIPVFTNAQVGLAGSEAPVVNVQHGRFGEVRLSTKLDGAWNFLGGLYAEDLGDVSRWTYYWTGDAASEAGAFGSYSPNNRFLGSDDWYRDSKQNAVFAEASWQFLPDFTLTGGARYYDYKRIDRRDTSGFYFGSSSIVRDKDADGTTFRGNLSYKPTEDSLVYASWSQGFRLGSGQAGLPPGTCDPDNDAIVDGTNLAIASTRSTISDAVDNFEIGSKVTLLDRRLSLTADVFRMNWSDMPVSVLQPAGAPANCHGAITANVGEARSEGVELQANFYLTRALRIDAGGSWVRARIHDATVLNSVVTAKAGARLPAPEYNANLSVQYDFAMGSADAFVRVDPTYVGSFYGNLDENPLTEAGGYLKVDARARVAFANRLSVDVFVQNLTNQDDFTFRGVALVGSTTSFGYRLRPRTVGLQLGYTF